MPKSPQTASSTPELLAELEKLLRQAAADNRITCTSAMAIGRSLGIHFNEVGKTANRLKIKISKCQLGCF